MKMLNLKITKLSSLEQAMGLEEQSTTKEIYMSTAQLFLEMKKRILSQQPLFIQTMQKKVPESITTEQSI